MVPAGLDGIVHELYAAQLLRRNLVASLTFLLWDICITFGEEVALIWTSPFNLWGIKPVYVFMRYYALFALVTTQLLNSRLTHKIPTPLHLCQSFFLFQLISASFITITADIIVMVRVYALYNRKLWVALTLSSLFIFDIIAIFSLIPFTLAQMHFNLFCLTTYPTSFYIIASLLALVPPVISFLFIAYKQVVSIREGWGKTPIMVLIVRDGTWHLMGLVAVWLINPLFSLLVGQSFSHAAHFWFLSIIPSIGCRVILNLLQLKTPETPEDPFTSITPVDLDSYQMASLGTIMTDNSQPESRVTSGDSRTRPRPNLVICSSIPDVRQPV